MALRKEKPRDSRYYSNMERHISEKTEKKSSRGRIINMFYEITKKE